MSDSHESVDLVADETVERLALAAVVAALTAALAQISIPVPGLPAPISFQPFGVYAAGLLLGARWGGLSMLLYVLTGAAGVPVFSSASGGLGVVLGPTGGYLVGYVLAAVVIGLLAHGGLDAKRPSAVPTWRQSLALLAGITVIYAVGVPWLAETTDYSLSAAMAVPLDPPFVALSGPTVSMPQAVVVGAAIFLPGDVLKILATLGIVRSGELDALVE
ncbi:biotin transporter BioY [Haloarchaeobius sp. FL176]|uniref:biotin transporter BioY n=1 Tax=Haloarchaeobius sp. FL176 TaxID=2967129 RepID=UPI00214895C9|nr:biotin transporter BioY [Haloarchaeobius sp. FL176]